MLICTDSTTPSPLVQAMMALMTMHLAAVPVMLGMTTALETALMLDLMRLFLISLLAVMSSTALGVVVNLVSMSHPTAPYAVTD